MYAALASTDAITWLSIFVKSLAYAGTLTAVGTVLVAASLQELSDGARESLYRTAALSACAAAVFTALRLPVQASFLMDGTWHGAFDSMILRMVAESPLGTSAALRLLGLALILLILWRRRVGLWIALFGALLASASFALRGHALSEPQMILGLLVTLHIMCIAFWIGAFTPLIRSTTSESPLRTGALAHEFGRQALLVVGLLILSGAMTLVLLGAVTPYTLSIPFGQMFAIKLILFAGMLSLAAVNKLALTPALIASKPGANARLRRSISIEVALLASILVTTATLTTISSPPTKTLNEKTSFIAPLLPSKNNRV